MFMLMGIAFAIWVLPETFGKSLEEMVRHLVSKLQ
jgi:DNA-directed RNA polymerase subunit E'/Rpb7